MLMAASPQGNLSRFAAEQDIFMRNQAKWAFVGLTILLSAGSEAVAQGPPGSAQLDEQAGSGVVVSAQPLQIKTAAGDVWYVMTDRDTKVRVDGTAEADYLH